MIVIISIGASCCNTRPGMLFLTITSCHLLDGLVARHIWHNFLKVITSQREFFYCNVQVKIIVLAAHFNS